MFLSYIIKYKAFKNEGLTVTKVVFEFFYSFISLLIKYRLTVTKVVFELVITTFFKYLVARLTVTKVVFEFKSRCRSFTSCKINSNKGCF